MLTDNSLLLRDYFFPRINLKNSNELKGVKFLKGWFKNGEENVGNRTRVRVVKNKLSPPFRTAEFDIMFGKGISKEGDVLDLAVEHKIVEKSGAWYSFNGERIGQGRENVKSYFLENSNILKEIESRVRTSVGIIGSKSLEETDSGSEEKANSDSKSTTVPK